MLVDREFSIGSTDHPQIEIFPHSHYLSGWICIDIVRRVDFSITPMADFLFLALKWWFYSCMQPANIAENNFTFFHFGKPTHHKGKKPWYCFYWSKMSSTTCDWSDAHFSLVRKTIQPIRICAIYCKSFFLKFRLG